MEDRLAGTRPRERLYLLLEELSFQNPVLRRETNLEDTRAGIFRWSAGPIEVDLIFPEEQRLSLMDPRLQPLTRPSFLLIARVGSSHEQPTIRTMNLSRVNQSHSASRQTIKSALGVNAATVSENSTPQLPEIKRKEAPRRDAWISLKNFSSHSESYREVTIFSITSSLSPDRFRNSRPTP